MERPSSEIPVTLTIYEQHATRSRSQSPHTQEKQNEKLSNEETLADRAEDQQSQETTEEQLASVSATAEQEGFVVDFDENDPEDPLTWPLWQKWSIVTLVAIMFTLANFGTITIVPVVPQLLADFGVKDKSLYSTLLVSI